MGIAVQEVRRNRLVVALLAACLSLTAASQLNGRSIFAIGEGRDGAFATLVQPDPKGVAGGIAPARGVIGRLLDSAGRGSGAAPAPAAEGPQPSGDGAASSGTMPEIAAVAAPATTPTAPGTGIGGESAGRGSDALPPFKGLLSQFAPSSGPAGFIPSDTPTPPTDGPTPPVTEPTVPVTDPTPPVSPVPEPAAWAMWLMGFGVVGGLVRWRRRALNPAATEGVGGEAA
ncbi:PEP-CTERM sorting domain-containing protein [Sphingomonas sp. dw_22]|uniref:PEP-CTERM sorting domain-containing protein n=1 Tax=Sphingomonas sp. dw_22 TaxID=2721175 RepID=UPI001BD2BC22|nr:PEP-CTERM sorting domain-containing protein [Sphingomonas sp. dw_22]